MTTAYEPRTDWEEKEVCITSSSGLLLPLTPNIFGLVYRKRSGPQRRKGEKSVAVVGSFHLLSFTYMQLLLTEERSNKNGNKPSGHTLSWKERWYDKKGLTFACETWCWRWGSWWPRRSPGRPRYKALSKWWCWPDWEQFAWSFGPAEVDRRSKKPGRISPSRGSWSRHCTRRCIVAESFPRKHHHLHLRLQADEKGERP